MALCELKLDRSPENSMVSPVFTAFCKKCLFQPTIEADALFYAVFPACLEGKINKLTVRLTFNPAEASVLFVTSHVMIYRSFQKQQASGRNQEWTLIPGQFTNRQEAFLLENVAEVVHETGPLQPSNKSPFELCSNSVLVCV